MLSDEDQKFLRVAIRSAFDPVLISDIGGDSKSLMKAFLSVPKRKSNYIRQFSEMMHDSRMSFREKAEYYIGDFFKSDLEGEEALREVWWISIGTEWAEGNG